MAAEGSAMTPARTAERLSRAVESLENVASFCDAYEAAEIRHVATELHALRLEIERETLLVEVPA
jgi:exopolyphosphatase/pppGpp-phosphohydrolase